MKKICINVLIGLIILSVGVVSFSSDLIIPRLYLNKLIGMEDDYFYEDYYYEQDGDQFFHSIENLNGTLLVNYTDLNSDGNLEMLVLLNNENNMGELRIYGIEEGQVLELENIELSSDSLRERVDYGYIDLDGRYIYILNSSYGMAGYDGTTTIELYKLENNTLVLNKTYVNTYETKSDDMDLIEEYYLLQGNEKIKLDPKDFKSLETKLDDNFDRIFVSLGSGGAGSMEINPDNMNKALDMLNREGLKNIRELDLEDVTKEFKGDKLKELQKFINKSYSIKNYNREFNSYAEFIIKYLYYDIDLTKEEIESAMIDHEKFYDSINKEYIDKILFDIFGKKLELNLPVVGDKYDFDNIDYSNKDVFTKASFNVPNKIYRLNDDSYYIQINALRVNTSFEQSYDMLFYKERIYENEFLDTYYNVTNDQIGSGELQGAFPTYMIVKENKDSSYGYSLIEAGEEFESLDKEDLKEYASLRENKDEVKTDDKVAKSKSSKNIFIFGILGLGLLISLVIFIRKKYS